MASWVTYARKILTSIAGELEQTAQEFNDAIYSLSVPKTGDAAESGVADDHESKESSMLSTCPPMPGSVEAGSIPEHLRAGSSYDVVRMTMPNPCSRPSSLKTYDSHGAENSRPSHLPARSSVGRQPSSSHNSRGSDLAMNHSYAQRQLDDSSLSSTATTRQPEPLGAFSIPMHPFQSIHNRLSRSSPSLSPISHENYGADFSDSLDGVYNNFAEDRDYLSSDICEIEPVRLRPLREDQLKALPFSISTPCLVHMQRILPSCIKKLNCPSSSLPSKHGCADKLSCKPNSLSSSLKRSSSTFECAGDKTEEKNLQASGTFGSCNKCSPSLGSKRPGKVVMVISQPHSCQEGDELEKEKMHFGSDIFFSGKGSDPLHKETDEGLASPDCVRTFELEINDAECISPKNVKNARSLGLFHSKAIKSKAHHCPGDADQVYGCGSQSQHDQQLLTTARSLLKIERQKQQTNWRMLAPLARVLTFAYSQVLNAMLLLQNDENSVSSESNRSRASSFSKEISASRPSSPPKLYAKTNVDTVQPISDTNKSRHKRQMSQLSLSGSVLSSDSFEVLDISDMESSNFVYVGGDSFSSDILQEYHLFPSKPSLSTTYSATPGAHPGAILTTSFPIHSLGSKEYSTGDLMSSSSADFAHFDFGELISNRQHNQLNPVIRSGTTGGAVWAGDDGKDAASADSVLESFVVLEENKSVLLCNSDLDDCDLPASGECNHEDSETSSFSVLSESEFETAT